MMECNIEELKDKLLECRDIAESNARQSHKGMSVYPNPHDRILTAIMSALFALSWLEEK